MATKKLNRAPLESGIYAAIMKDREAAEQFVGKSRKELGARGLADAVQRKIKRLPNYKLVLLVAELVSYREGKLNVPYKDIFYL